MTEHKHAKLLRMAADNADQMFECDDFLTPKPLKCVLDYPKYNWRPVAKPKKTIKRWLWSDKEGCMTGSLYSEEELETDFVDDAFAIKLLWSETEFEVDDEY